MWLCPYTLSPFLSVLWNKGREVQQSFRISSPSDLNFSNFCIEQIFFFFFLAKKELPKLQGKASRMSFLPFINFWPCMDSDFQRNINKISTPDIPLLLTKKRKKQVNSRVKLEISETFFAVWFVFLGTKFRVVWKIYDGWHLMNIYKQRKCQLLWMAGS